MKKIEPQWIHRSALEHSQYTIDSNTFNWIARSTNLTESIKKAGMAFSLTLVSQVFEKPYQDEMNVLNTYATGACHSFVRKVILEGDKASRIFARVIIPEPTYLNYYEQFSRLGDSPIGNTILYADKNIIRHAFEYRLIGQGDEMFQELKHLKQIDNDSDTYWARRSIFVLPRGALLISELFLNTTMPYLG